MKKVKKTLKLFDIFVLVLTMAGVFMMFVYIFQKQNYMRVTLKVTDQNILYADSASPSWFAYFFRKGMVEKDSLGRTVAEITDVYLYDSGDNPRNDTNEKVVFLHVTLKTNANRRSGKYFFKGKSVLVGKPIVVEFNDIFFQGLVTETEFSPRLYEEKDVVVKTKIINRLFEFPNFTGEMQHVIDALHIGDKMTDISGEPVVTILDKKVLPSKIETVDRYGNVLLKNDLILKDVYLTLKIHVNEINGEYYLFDDTRIKVGKKVPVILPHISVWPEVTEFVND